MNRLVRSTTLTLAVITPFVMRGQDLHQDLPDNPNRFSFGPTFGFNFKARFYDNINPGPAAGDANHTYNDGYVLVDSSGDAGGLTRNWGYQNASQVAGGNINYHAIQDYSSTSGNPQYGAELIYQRVLGPLPFLSGDWGLETGFGFTELDLRENLGGTAPATIDSFPLNGVIPPGAGYNGTSSGPGPLLGDTPTRTATSAAVSGYQKLSGQLFSLRLGPLAEWNLTHKLTLAASVGLTLAPTKVDYDFSETGVLAAGGGVITESGHSSKTKLLYGPYVGAMLHYDLSKCWDVYVGARFQHLDKLDVSSGGHTAQLDPGLTVYATAGLTWKF
jgi:hypothetical protein